MQTPHLASSQPFPTLPSHLTSDPTPALNDHPISSRPSSVHTRINTHKHITGATPPAAK
jgi:hypothetical protein